MQNGQDRMVVEHAGTGISHHGLYSLPHVGFVTVYRAFGADRFTFLKRAFLQALLRVVKQLPALRAQGALIVMTGTIQSDHDAYGRKFPG
jgi:hypothetical protein